MTTTSWCATYGPSPPNAHSLHARAFAVSRFHNLSRARFVPRARSAPPPLRAVGPRLQLAHGNAQDGMQAARREAQIDRPVEFVLQAALHETQAEAVVARPFLDGRP